MSQGNVFYLTLLVLAMMALVLILNINGIFSTQRYEKYLSYNDVKGIDIEHNQILYTLNFNQQNQIITDINNSIPIGAYGIPSGQKLNFTKLIIYRFNAPNLIMTPVRYESDELIFRIPQLKKDGFFKDISQGMLKEVIEGTYDNS